MTRRALHRAGRGRRCRWTTSIGRRPRARSRDAREDLAEAKDDAERATAERAHRRRRSQARGARQSGSTESCAMPRDRANRSKRLKFRTVSPATSCLLRNRRRQPHKYMRTEWHLRARWATARVTGMKHWTLDDIPWDRFDRSRVDPESAASRQGRRHGRGQRRRLCELSLQRLPRRSRVPAGRARLGDGRGAARRGARRAGPSWPIPASISTRPSSASPTASRSRPGAPHSIRGSRTGELVARCIVETGTSSYYTALMDAVDEPVLKEICRNIAADEFRHYKLFYAICGAIWKREKIGRLRRVWSRSRASASPRTTSWPTPTTPPMPAATPYERRRYIVPMRAAPMASTGRIISGRVLRCCSRRRVSNPTAASIA